MAQFRRAGLVAITDACLDVVWTGSRRGWHMTYSSRPVLTSFGRDGQPAQPRVNGAAGATGIALYEVAAIRSR